MTTFIVCCIAGFITAIAYGSYLINTSKHYNEDFHFPIATNVADVAADWSTIPLVDIQVGSGYNCPLGSEAIFNRNWYGLHLACDCTGSDTWYSSGDFQIGHGCEVRSGCATILA